MNTDLTPVIKSLLDAFEQAGLKLTEFECGGGAPAPPPHKQQDLIAQVLESHTTDFTFSKDGDDFWLRIHTDNEPESIIHDFTSHPVMDAIVWPWSDSWQDCVYVPQRVTKK